MQKEYRVGIDEVGRGPLAGPLSVGAFAVPSDFDLTLLEGMRDSKALSPKKRERLAERLPLFERAGARFAYIEKEAKEIDVLGVSEVLRCAVAECLAQLALSPKVCTVLLDGGLSAPKEYAQETIVHGDAREITIATASVLAKVRRDAHMVCLDTQYPAYGFARHKGYGTALHLKMLRMHGLCPEHRRTFCGNV